MQKYAHVQHDQFIFLDEMFNINNGKCVQGVASVHRRRLVSIYYYKYHDFIQICCLVLSLYWSIFHPNRLSQLKGHLLLMIIIPKQCNFSPRILMYMYNLLFTCLITKACPFQMTPTWLSISSYVHLYSPTLLPSKYNKKLNLAINFLILGLLRSILSLQTLKVV